MKKISIILSANAKQVYDTLNEQAPTSKIHRMILDSINDKLEFIKQDIHYANPIAKNLIPKEYIIKYEITNLFRVELPNFWRMLYTLTNIDTQDEIIVFILDIIDHKTYNKKFGYRDK